VKKDGVKFETDGKKLAAEKVHKPVASYKKIYGEI
jgi:hypothetical protein